MVKVTNTLEGRTYFDYRWYIREGAQQYFSVRHGCWLYEEKDVTVIKTFVVVANGKWVKEHLLGRSGYSWLIGITHDQLENRLFTDKHGIQHVLEISDKPFGYIVVEEEDMDTSVYPAVIKPTGRKRLVCAQQVHKGELGQSVAFPRVDYVRQPFEPGQRPSVTKAHQRRRGYGWVRLGDLGEMTVGYNPIQQLELVLHYWQFSGHLHYENAQRLGTLVDTVRGSKLDIELGNVSVVSMTQEQFRAEAEIDTSELWIRRGFAFTILRLMALGVHPSAMQPA